MAGYRVLDIETVVDRRYWDPPTSKWTERPLNFEQTVGHVMTSWTEEEPFPPPQAHRVVAIAMVHLSADDDLWYSLEDFRSDCGWGYGAEADEIEADMLREFGKLQDKDGANIVTWNGRTFDLPVINLRSFLHRIPCKWYYEESDVRYRYSEVGHCDVMDVFSDYGAARAMKLGDVARLAGLPGKIGEVKGNTVGDIYRAYDPSDLKPKGMSLAQQKAKLVDVQAAVGAYCLLDALQTAVLFARSRVHKGMIEQDYYDRVVAPSFKEALGTIIARVKEERL